MYLLKVGYIVYKLCFARIVKNSNTIEFDRSKISKIQANDKDKPRVKIFRSKSNQDLIHFVLVNSYLAVDSPVNEPSNQPSLVITRTTR